MPNEILIPKAAICPRSKETLSRMIGCRVTQEVDDKLDALAAQSEYTKAKIIGTVISRNIDRIRVVDLNEYHKIRGEEKPETENTEALLDVALDLLAELVYSGENEQCHIVKYGRPLCGGTETADCKICILEHLKEVSSE